MRYHGVMICCGLCVVFSIFVHSAYGEYPTSLVACDFDTDGNSDLIYLTTESLLKVYLGDGNGNFEKAGIYDAREGGDDIAAGRINNDEVPDLITNGGNHKIPVLYGTGTGGFKRPDFIRGHGGGNYIGIGDLSNDGRVDIVTDGLRVYVQNKDGKFNLKHTLYVDGKTQDPLIVDVNNDRVNDLVVANIYRLPRGKRDRIAVRLGTRNGKFEERKTTKVGASPKSLASSDLNGDNFKDLVVGNHGSLNVSILLGNGDGSFDKQDPVKLPKMKNSSYVRSVALSCFNDDRHVDLAIASAKRVFIFLGVGDGSFNHAATYRVGEGVHDMIVEDFDSDHVNDLATLNAESHDVSILIGKDKGLFQEEKRLE